MEDLPAELRTKLERNTGFQVVVVLNDSPAFRANILEGDVVLKMNGQDVLSQADGISKLAALAGQQVTIQVWRHGDTKDILVQLNP
jgi:S1-C subfamily serine protease